MLALSCFVSFLYLEIQGFCNCCISVGEYTQVSSPLDLPVARSEVCDGTIIAEATGLVAPHDSRVLEPAPAQFGFPQIPGDSSKRHKSQGQVCSSGMESHGKAKKPKPVDGRAEACSCGSANFSSVCCQI